MYNTNKQDSVCSTVHVHRTLERSLLTVLMMSVRTVMLCIIASME